VNVTLAIDDQLVARARRFAQRRGTTLNQLVRDHLERLTAGTTSPTVVEEFERMWAEAKGHSGGRRWKREDLYRQPLLG